ncbi:unnamed protein product [Staurois parvus]|uniref:Uncharacterized protein n=1 Tax=Staurois parvus TaxID=386267 RepID=A0ABN9E7A5_9NEOB|nr:unnamed protein product [Staurois parvus]
MPVRQVLFSWQLPNTDASIGLPDKEAQFITPENTSPLSSGGVAIAVFPSCFHFVIIPLIVDRGIFSSQEMSRMDLLHRWQPITVPHLNSLSY